jgi:C4-dicarboxylate-specific signal transduction histidine kinase
MESYLQRFLTLGRPHAARRERTLLAPLVDDVTALVQPGCLHSAVQLTAVKPSETIEPLAVRGDADELRQLLVNLVLNAIDAVSAQAASERLVKIILERTDSGRATLCVADNGPGPSAEVAARLFEPFVTGKPEGTGLGLFVARQIAEDHQGSLTWRRCEGWTEFRLEVPVGSRQ